MTVYGVTYSHDFFAADPAWRGALAHPQLTRLDLPNADHTFSDAAAAQAVELATGRWLDQLAQTAQIAGTHPTAQTAKTAKTATAHHGG